MLQPFQLSAAPCCLQQCTQLQAPVVSVSLPGFTGFVPHVQVTTNMRQVRNAMLLSCIPGNQEVKLPILQTNKVCSSHSFVCPGSNLGVLVAGDRGSHEAAVWDQWSARLPLAATASTIGAEASC